MRVCVVCAYECAYNVQRTPRVMEVKNRTIYVSRVQAVRETVLIEISFNYFFLFSQNIHRGRAASKLYLAYELPKAQFK